MKKNIEEFETIYHANYEIISKHVLIKTSNVNDAQDIVQDVFYDFYKHWLKSEKAIEYPSAYLKQIANHHLSSYYHQKSHEDSSQFEDTNLNQIADLHNIENEVIDELTLDLIFNEINLLKEPDKSILVARYRFDMTFKEIAEQFNIAESTIKSIVQRNLLKLKEKFSSKSY